MSSAIVDLARAHKLVVSVEDNVRTGGVGSSIAAALRDAELDVPFRDFGIPRVFLHHASRSAIHTELGLTAQDVSRAIVETVARIENVDSATAIIPGEHDGAADRADVGNADEAR